jgi:multidrug efflux system outer membrane protein
MDTTAKAGVGASWESDAFGGNQRRHEAAEAAMQVAKAAFENVQLSLLAEIARNYVNLRSLQQQESITRKNLDIQRSTLGITQGRRREGVSADLEVVRAQAQVNTTSSRLPQIAAAQTAVINRLAVLTATPANDIRALAASVAPIPAVAKELVVATPVDVMAQRPDVRAAERRLAQAAALSNAAFTQFFPKLTLDGFFGVGQSDNFGSTSPWGMALNGLVPLLNFGTISSQVDAANARQQQAFYEYKKTVLQAVEETEVALSNYVQETERHKTLVLAASQQTEAARLAREQYEAGVASQLDLLVAEENQLNAQNDAVLSEAAVAQNLVLLHRALGKDWRT